MRAPSKVGLAAAFVLLGTVCGAGWVSAAAQDQPGRAQGAGQAGQDMMQGHGSMGHGLMMGQGSTTQGTANPMQPMHQSPGDPDVDFARSMIPHHQGAIDMAEAYLEQGDDPEIRAMAETIIADQRAEIREFRTWLARQGIEDDAPTAEGTDRSAPEDAPG